MAQQTATTHGARDHAGGQAGQYAEAMPVLPARAWPGPPDGVQHVDMLWAVARGTTIRLRDVAGHACAHVLLFNAVQTAERLNVAGTSKVLWRAYLGAGRPQLSDQARVLATVVADTSGHHDAFCGTSAAATNTARYGDGSPQGPYETR